MVIGGFTVRRFAKCFGALRLGVYEPGGNALSGKVGTVSTKALSRRGKRGAWQGRAPFAIRPRAEARTGAWSSEDRRRNRFTSGRRRHARHPAFQGLREDKRPEDVVRERPSTRTATLGGLSPKPSPEPGENVIAGVALSNAGKPLYPDAGITKRDIARYYETIAEWILPHLRNRPTRLLRCPNGWKQNASKKHADRSDPTCGAVS